MATSALKSVLAKAHSVFKLRMTTMTPSNSTATSTSDPSQLEKFASELQSLSESMDTLNADNIDLHDLIEQIPLRHRQPITFIQVCETPVLSGVIIVMQPGSGIPLHDHPGMYGMIKVLYGQLCVRTYTPVGDADKSSILPAARSPDMILTRLSETQTLTPFSRNFHQIEYVSGEGGKEYAAFLDILSPPYQDDIGCHYYRTDELDARKPYLGESKQPTCTLIETDCPKDYRTSSVCL